MLIKYVAPIDTWLPIFTGHYEGYLQNKINGEIESDLEYYNSDEGGKPWHH